MRSRLSSRLEKDEKIPMSSKLKNGEIVVTPSPEVVAPALHSNIAYVEFIARFMHQGTIKHIHELSEFKHSNHQWYDVDGTTPSKSILLNP
jgi:hypothetical protein